MLGNGFRDYYLGFQQEYKCRYLPGDKIVIQTKDERIRPAEITGVYLSSLGTCYNGRFLDNGNNEFFFDIPEGSILNGGQPIQLKLL